MPAVAVIAVTPVRRNPSLFGRATGDLTLSIQRPFRKLPGTTSSSGPKKLAIGLLLATTLCELVQ